MKSSSVLPCWASACRTVLEHQEGELEELGEQLDDEDGGLNLGVDALHHRAPAAGLLLLIFSANSCAPCRRLTCHSNPPESSCQCGSEGSTIMDKRTRAQGSRYDLD